ncbi:MAG: hypothetical protein DWQ02_20970 [Bacteroidetes bacterium]|nr:MAG: hypothetical protein DWQ02_20970 [Bacteroidota bacterium]
MKEVDSPSKAHFYRITYLNKKGKPEGTTRDYYISGELKWEGELTFIDRNEEKNNRFNGICTWYLKNGKISKIIRYDNNFPFEFMDYYEDGELEEWIKINKDKSIVFLKKYDKNGALKEILRDEDGYLIKSTFTNGTEKFISITKNEINTFESRGGTFYETNNVLDLKHPEYKIGLFDKGFCRYIKENKPSSFGEDKFFRIGFSRGKLLISNDRSFLYGNHIVTNPNYIIYHIIDDSPINNGNDLFNGKFEVVGNQFARSKPENYHNSNQSHLRRIYKYKEDFTQKFILDLNRPFVLTITSNGKNGKESEFDHHLEYLSEEECYCRFLKEITDPNILRFLVNKGMVETCEVEIISKINSLYSKELILTNNESADELIKQSFKFLNENPDLINKAALINKIGEALSTYSVSFELYETFCLSFKDNLNVETVLKNWDRQVYLKAKKQYGYDEENCNYYIEKFPDGLFSTEIKRELDKFDYNNAIKENTIDSYQKFIYFNRFGFFIDEAKNRIQEIKQNELKEQERLKQQKEQRIRWEKERKEIIERARLERMAKKQKKLKEEEDLRKKRERINREGLTDEDYCEIFHQAWENSNFNGDIIDCKVDNIYEIGSRWVLVEFLGKWEGKSILLNWGSGDWYKYSVEIKTDGSAYRNLQQN